MWELQSTTRALVAHAEWVHGTVFEPGTAILTWAVELSGQVVSRFQRSVSDGKTAYERRKRVPFGELVMFMPIEKPKDKGGESSYCCCLRKEHQRCAMATEPS